MLTSILHPVVHGGPHGSPRRVWLRLALLHSLGAVAAAVALGGLLAFLAWGATRLGARPFPLALWGAVGVAVLYLPRQFGWTRFPPLLQSTRQVPRHWAYDYSRGMAALLFGLGLGSGLYTRIIVPTFYLLLVWPFLAPGSWWPLAAWAAYGLVRSGNVWLLALTAPADDLYPYTHRLVAALMQKGAWMRYANAVMLALVVVWLAAWGALG